VWPCPRTTIRRSTPVSTPRRTGRGSESVPGAMTMAPIPAASHSESDVLIVGAGPTGICEAQ
jgi:hypothetical protein